MTTYSIRLLSNAISLGTCTLTAEQFARYEQASQQPEGAIVLGDLMDLLWNGNMYDGLKLRYDDQGTQVTVYLDEDQSGWPARRPDLQSRK